MMRRTAAAAPTTSCPSMRADPPVGRSRVVSIRTVVDFPAPLGPRKPNTSPRATARSMPATATTSPKWRSRPVASMTRSLEAARFPLIRATA